jgi:hypothetical protein
MGLSSGLSTALHEAAFNKRARHAEVSDNQTFEFEVNEEQYLCVDGGWKLKPTPDKRLSDWLLE